MIPAAYQLDHYPKITLVTPNYNQGDFIERTLKSVLDQGYPNLEYIVIDGGSTDHSVAIIKKYADRLSYWVSEPDKGMYDAIQKGFAQSTGEIMGWINSDDMHRPLSLFKLATLFNTYAEVKWLMGYPTLINEQDEIIWQGQDAPVHEPLFFYLYNYLRTFSFLQQESTFWRRDLWERAGGTLNTQYKLAGDFELWLRFFKESKLYFSHQQLSSFRKREGQKSEDRDNYIAETKKAIAAHQVGLGAGFKLKLLLAKVHRKLTKLVGAGSSYHASQARLFFAKPRWLDKPAAAKSQLK